jgi:hypothetical protein
MNKKAFAVFIIGLTLSLAAGYWLGRKLIDDWEAGAAFGFLVFNISFWRKFLPWKSRVGKEEAFNG